MVSNYIYAIRIQSCIKKRCLLGIGCKDIFDEICYVYGQNEISFSSVIYGVMNSNVV
jgi:hypothetical protein